MVRLSTKIMILFILVNSYIFLANEITTLHKKNKICYKLFDKIKDFKSTYKINFFKK